MGKLVVTVFVSIDGVFEDPGGSESYENGGWTFEYDRGDEGNVERMQLSDLTVDEAIDLGAKAGALIGLGFGADEESMRTGALLGAAEGSDGHLIDADAWYVDDVIPNGSAAAIALVEHRWAIPLREAIWDANGFHLADAWVHPEDLVRVGIRAADELNS